MLRRASISILTTVALLALAGCERPPAAAFSAAGEPASLLDVSSEVVNLSVASKDEVRQLGDWIRKDQPTRAEIYCASGDLLCSDAKKLLDLKAVPSVMVPSDRRMVSLVYERILARDCSPRFTGKPADMFGTHDGGFGCATAANIVQHVSNKQQLLNPNISDDAYAVDGVLTMQRLHAPKQAAEAYGGGEEVTR